jgi:hypothetical protein
VRLVILLNPVSPLVTEPLIEEPVQVSVTNPLAIVALLDESASDPE